MQRGLLAGGGSSYCHDPVWPAPLSSSWLATGSTAASQVGDQLHKLPPIKRSPTGGTSLVRRLEADTTRSAASEEPVGVSKSLQEQREGEVGNCLEELRKVWSRTPLRS